jgi:hypothetical protein
MIVIEPTPTEEEAVAAFTVISHYLVAAQNGAEQPADAQADAPARKGPPQPRAKPEAEAPAEPEEPAPIIALTEGEIFTPDDEEAAAALVAVSIYLAQEQALAAQQLAAVQERWQWQASRVLLNQGIRPTRTAVRPKWNNVDRLRRGGNAMTGIVGM